MKSQLFAKTEKQLSSYFAVYRELLTATNWINTNTGESYKFSCEEKIIWCWMLDRFQFFKEQNGVWFDNQDEIAAYCGVGLSTVKRFIKKLTQSGVLLVEKKPMGGARVSNSYVITQDLVLVQEEETSKASVVESVPVAVTEPYNDGDEVKGHLFEQVPEEFYNDYYTEEQEECSDAYMDYADTDLTTKPIAPTAMPVSVENKAPASLDHIDLRTMPRLICHPNGVMTPAMMDWFENRGFYIEDTADWIIHLKGNRYKFENRNFKYLSTVQEIVFKEEEEELSDLPF
ncbi:MULTISPECIES: DUF6945 domain-containing protein [Pseudomonas]|uniref:DUF6945 domain-containing protein n=1 Tax=Pseudomonas TaxID=286 RepID=UPI000921CD5F|nr:MULTISPECIES: hypothetical protein [Pseudomonas]SHI35614.1 hypothetical protein SAMN05216295_101359 [Pseudomonas zeshuii]